MQVLVPGFTVEELPLRLTNVNNLRFAPDGRLFALAYDGRVYVLRDRDGDGLEDTAEPFWDKPTIQVPVGMAWSPEGLYLSSHGKVSLLRDTDNDGQADVEEVVASGWPPTDVASGGVDATAVTLDRDGNLYFGLVCADYSNPYRVQDGISHYDIQSPRGTIQMISADRKTRDTVCTGIRVPYTLAFNRHGDLFVTDQEGETWLPGGNPLDELNHIIRGRHYGFPPQHDKYLPDVIDEPPVVAFGPQHQSTCGLVFNEWGPGRKLFGPQDWKDDAFIAGFSRGKIWRVRLVKTPHGYVGKSAMFATAQMLVADLAISHRGEMYVTCHSGQPDWGTGPQGEGRIFKIAYSDVLAPQPIAAWAAGPLEVRIHFDRPLQPSSTGGLVGRTIDFDEYVRAGDRFEVLRPGYASVKTQLESPRGKLRIANATKGASDYELVLTTDPHPAEAMYTLTLPKIRRFPSSRGRGATRDPPPPPEYTMDIAYDLHGVEATLWDRDAGSAAAQWSSWLPHLDTVVAEGLIGRGYEFPYIVGMRFLKRPALLRLDTMLSLPSDSVSLRFEANNPFRGSLAGTAFESQGRAGSRQWAELVVESDGQSRELFLAIDFDSEKHPPVLTVSYHTATDRTERPIPLSWLQPRWVPPPLRSPAMPEAPAVELAGADRSRGEAVFFSDEAKCSACHTVRGKGGKIGPDLSNLVHRDVASVLRDITEPNATINPDYVSYMIALSDGRVLTGVVRAEGADAIRVSNSDAKETVVRRSEIEELRPSANSIMPTGAADTLGEAKLRDLLAFLLTDPVEPAKPDEPHPPPPRTRAEVEAVLRALQLQSDPGKGRPLNVVLLAGPQDHGPGEHDYPDWQRKWQELLKTAPDVRVSTPFNWPSREQWDEADLVIAYLWTHEWTAERYKDVDDYLARGAGLVLLHAAVIADSEPERLAERLGLAAQPGRTKYRHGPLELKFVGGPDQPITRGLSEVAFYDETYWPMIGDATQVKILATAVEEEKEWPMLWTFQRGKGRVFGSILGHYSWTFDDPLFRIPLLRGMAWAAGEPISRFQSLATMGVILRDR